MWNLDDEKVTKAIRYGSLAVAGISLLFALGHAVFPNAFDETTALFLGIALVALVIDQITKFKGFGIEFEKTVQQLQEKMGHVESTVDDLGKTVGPGSRPPMPPSGVAEVQAAQARRGIDSTDPNKGRFGGSPESNGRCLTASIEPAAGPENALCQVSIAVSSTDAARPLAGKVRIHLHPTFGRWTSYELDVRGGVARDKFRSYGVFTIGVVADDGETQLELDLATVDGGTKRFYEN